VNVLLFLKSAKYRSSRDAFNIIKIAKVRKESDYEH